MNEIVPKEPNGRTDSTSFEQLSLLLLSYVFLPAFILSTFLLLRVGSPSLAYWGSLVVLSWLLWNKRKEIGVAGCMCFLMIIISAHAFSWHFFDVFHDSLAFHQPATALIATGFNPVYDGYMDLGRPPNWIKTAATWYFAASVYAALGDIQLGTAFNLILLFSALFFVLHHTREESLMRRFLWVLACLNPIAFLQSTSHLVDGALGSLSVIALFYAYLHFSGKPIPRDAHVIAIISLAMMFCVKASGLAFGSIIIFCICLHRLFKELTTDSASKNSWITAFSEATKLGLKIGIPTLLLVAVLGFSPYLTNLLGGRHIFHPLIQSTSAYSDVQIVLEELAHNNYPDAHNRVTRLLRSIASYPSFSPLEQPNPARLKNPLRASRHEWEMFGVGSELHAGGLGPLFFLLLLTSLAYYLLSRARGNRWLIFTLCLMVLVMPHSWLLRYVPFLWVLPFVFCLSTPRRWEYFLSIPILLAMLNTGGVTYISLRSAEENRRSLVETFAPHRGGYVLLDRTFLWHNGVFDRFGITQVFSNPNETVFLNRVSPITFEENIPHIPELPVIFAEEDARIWERMSDGFRHLYTLNTLPKGFWNYAYRMRFFMRVTEKPASDIVFAMTASLWKNDATVRPQKMSIYANHRRIGEWLWGRQYPEEKTITISQEVLKESHGSPMNLLILAFYMLAAETSTPAPEFSIVFKNMEFR